MTDKKINFNDRFASRQDVQSNLTLEHSSPGSQSHIHHIGYRLKIPICAGAPEKNNTTMYL